MATPIPDTTTIQTYGDHLILGGGIYQFTGVNAYEAATDWGTNAGCGADLSDGQLNQLFSSLPPNSLVRIWAFQETMATDVHTGQLDWGPLDRVFAAAAAHDQRLVVVITGQGSGCDGGHWQDPSWYDGGFMDVYNSSADSDGKGLMPLSYWQYLQDIVSRYATSPALGMWEPISEPEASTCPPQFEPTNCSGNQTCPDEAVAAQSLRHFFDVVGTEIHTLDPDHLVESGLIGGGQCGSQGADYQYVSASPGIDVLSYHDYFGSTPLGGDQSNGVGAQIERAQGLDKPIIAGEEGVTAGSDPGCTALSLRNSELQAKVDSQVAAGTSGVLAWNWVPVTQAGCSYDIGPSDPVVQPGGALEG